MLDKKQLGKELHFAGLKLIRKIVETENRGVVTPAADWDTDEWIRHKAGIKAKQDALVDIGCVQFIGKHISEVEDDSILEEALLVGIALLLGGNPKTQEAFVRYFHEQDEYNRVLQKLKQMLLKSFEAAKQYLGEKNGKLLVIAKTEERTAQ